MTLWGARAEGPVFKAPITVENNTATISLAGLSGAWTIEGDTLFCADYAAATSGSMASRLQYLQGGAAPAPRVSMSPKGLGKSIKVYADAEQALERQEADGPRPSMRFGAPPCVLF